MRGHRRRKRCSSKDQSLLECRADITVISPKPHPEISKLSEERMIRLIERDYKTSDLKDAVIAIVCTDAKKVNRKAADEARKAGALVNVADDPDRSDFIIPSFFRRGNLTLAVSTSGVSPALAKKSVRNSKKASEWSTPRYYL